ncbi:MAG: epoxide hydrolase [Proteobacteria bacterium]|nr:MAG: epoxide hydrolase [Pseudomonadota bacterium]
MTIEPFRIEVSDADLADLRERLARTRFPDQIEGAGWDYGTELSYLQELVAYWRDRYDWRTHEALLNSFPQFTTTVDDHRLHFLHVRSPHADAFPLVVTHGWPGSIFEFHKILGPLTDPTRHDGDARDAFHVVCPSIPGYGFSEAPRTRGWDARKMAEGNAALMAQLGYAKYGAQGGDWGAIISVQNALVDAAHCAAIHLNMVVAFPPGGMTPEALAGVTPEEQKDLADLGAFQANETGYQQIQGTKPQTLGYGLNDSPAGLAAWIVEKFRTWSDCDGDVERRFTKDELLTNVMIYWITRSITSSTRLYYETMKSGRFGPATERVEQPTAGAIFPKELYRAPRAWAEKAFNVQRWTRMPSGGHFAALEEPARLVDDVRAFFRTVR